MNTNSGRSNAKTLAAVLLLGMLAGCAGGSKSSSCTNCVPPVKSEFLYTTALNQIALFNVDSTNGTLTPPVGLNAGIFPGPNDAEGLVADPQLRFLFVSDFTGSLLRVFNVNTSNGRLTEVTGSPFPLDASGPRGLVTDAGGKFLFVADFNSNEISVFNIGSSGALTRVTGSPFFVVGGSSPAFLLLHPSGNFLYASNLNSPTGAISAFSINATTGALTQISGSPFPTAGSSPGPSMMASDPTGKFLYVSLSGTANANNQVAAFTVNSSTGALTPIASPVTVGRDPQGLAVTPDGKFLFIANFLDNTISAFSIDATTGVLTPITGSPFTANNAPFRVAIDPSGKFLDVTNNVGGNISVFTINSSTNSSNGLLSPIAGSPFGTLTQPKDLLIVKIP
jgi:6-phosphogluconolactonase